MNLEESEKLDYKAVCKRCFMYLKTNCKEEILPELVDYLKGYRVVILEEFTMSLIKLPSLYLYPIGVLDFLIEKI